MGVKVTIIRSADKYLSDATASVESDNVDEAIEAVIKINKALNAKENNK